MTGNGGRKVSSLRDLPRDIAPPRDLWQGIEARIAADDERATARRRGRAGWMRVLAAAAVIAALAIGIWIGRSVLPVGRQPGTPITASNSGPEAGSFQVNYLMGSKYARDRAALVKDLEARLGALPPDSRAKVVASLKTLNDSKQELEKELGKDPSNALLQELLVNTYQDEMRVLTTVHEAGGSGEGI